MLTKLRNIASISRSIKKLQPTIGRLKTNLFSKYLLATNLAISVTLSGAGDFIEQMIEIFSKYQTEWNKKRTMKLASTGLSLGFICHYWYIYLDRRFAETNYRIVVSKMLLSQFVCSPLCIMAFFLTLGLLNKWSTEQILKNTIEKGKQLYLAEWIIWPPALIFSFYFLPTRYRVLYDSTLSLGFDVYNSYVVHKEFRNKKIE